MSSFQEVSKGVLKRTRRRELGLFIDGTGLDRATRRLKRKVDIPSLVKGVTAGITPVIARYYTLIPYEDDSRQHAFLDAVRRAGVRVVVKRLPPKGVSRQVSVDVEMSADIVAFALGHKTFGSLSEYLPDVDHSSARKSHKSGAIPLGKIGAEQPTRKSEHSVEDAQTTDPPPEKREVERIVTVVCPGRDLSYPIALAGELGVDTVTADFGQFKSGDVLKSAAKWIDLSDSETIWRD